MSQVQTSTEGQGLISPLLGYTAEQQTVSRPALCVNTLGPSHFPAAFDCGMERRLLFAKPMLRVCRWTVHDPELLFSCLEHVSSMQLPEMV